MGGNLVIIIVCNSGSTVHLEESDLERILQALASVPMNTGMIPICRKTTLKNSIRAEYVVPVDSSKKITGRSFDHKIGYNLAAYLFGSILSEKFWYKKHNEKVKEAKCLMLKIYSRYQLGFARALFDADKPQGMILWLIT